VSTETCGQRSITARTTRPHSTTRCSQLSSTRSA
jgi:hypothetical protein